jgi:hypothetical protein
MLVFQFVAKLLLNVALYTHVLLQTSFDVLKVGALEQKKFYQFYLIHLPISAFGLWFLSSVSQQNAASDVDPICYPAGLSVAGLLILAEVAAMALFAFSYLQALFLVFVRKGSPFVIAVLRDQAEVSAKLRVAYLARTLFRPAIGWFPLAVLVAATASSSRLGQLADICFRTQQRPSAAAWMLALIFPGLIVGYFAAVAINWAWFKWKWNRELIGVLAVVLLGYCAALLIVGPADVLGLVDALRRLPDLVVAIAKLVGL